MAVAPQHWLSMARLVVGAVAWLSLSRADSAGIVLPLVLVACLLDFSDGRLARARGSEGPAGRALDNICDFGFLAIFFHACAGIGLWSDPVAGAAARWWRYANHIPLVVLTMSFGSYVVRAALCAVSATPLAPSNLGRMAGISNYALALVGAASVSLRWGRPSLLVEAAMVLVAFINVAACVQNCVLLVRLRHGRP
jgi:phosphatidylglycerophosphate synthase